MATRKGGLQGYTVQESGNAALGQAGSILVENTSEVTALGGRVFVAIQFLEDTVFSSADTGLKSAGDRQTYPDSSGGSTSISAANGVSTDGEIFPAGITIYGRWLSFQLASGLVIAYVG